MTKITSSLFVATLLALCLHVASARAQLVRTCVSMAKGSDANSSSFCHCTTPCRTFAVAHDNTLPDGEITVLDPGDYGGLTITKSISINNDSGGEASITVSGGTTGIIINAPSGAGYVNLRGLTIQGVGFGAGGTGLRFNSGFSLIMENCVVRNHTGNGILFLPNASANLVVSNTLVADNGGDGISIQPTGSGVTVKATLRRVEAYNNSFDGLLVSGNASTGTITATVEDTVAANNTSSGFRVNSVAGAATSLMIVRSVAANNNTGVFTFGAFTTLRLGQSAVTGNTTSWFQSGGVLRSYGDNYIDGNGDGNPAPTTIAKH